MPKFEKAGFLERLRHVAQLSSTRGKLANAMGVVPSTLSNYLQGLAIPKADAIANLALNMKINPSWLLLGEGTMTHGQDDSLGDSRQQAFTRLNPTFTGEQQDIPEARKEETPLPQPCRQDSRERLLDKAVTVLREHGGSDAEIREAVRLILAGGDTQSGQQAIEEIA
jgi:transcriptional regulator with XRE-family HTH domain